MYKYLLVPVSNAGNVLIGIEGAILINQASTTTVTIDYDGGSTTTITHSTMSSSDETVRDRIIDSILALTSRSSSEAFITVSLAGLVSAAGSAVTISGIANA
tara:strand:+ start:7433 stop:7738 length:306 start_codon:yes stop_codon:yes gene_type:complete